MDLKFDPSGFERAAQALKEINSSKYAEKALDLAKLSETKQIKDQELKAAQATLQSEKLAAQRVKIEAEERLKALAQQIQNEKALAQYKAQLDIRTNAEREAELSRVRQEGLREEQRIQRETALVKLQTERALLKEKLKAAKKEAELSAIVEKEKVKEEMLGRIRQERDNKDVRFETMKLQSSLEIRKLESILNLVSNGARSLLSNQATRRQIFISAVALIASFHASKNFSTMGRELISYRLMTPKLIREKSWGLTRSLIRRQRLALSPLTLTTIGQSQIDQLADDLRYRREVTALFEGPPGTGKSTMARQLALQSGKKFAICSGGDFLATGIAGISQMTRLFEWARHQKGLVLFIDEAEAFLKRGRESITALSEEARAALSTFLYLTGSHGSGVSIILATNTPQLIDPAVVDRMEHHISFQLPDLSARQAIFRKHLEQILARVALSRRPWWQLGRRRELAVEKLPTEDLDALSLDLAHKTESWSGRAIAQMCQALQSRVIRSEKPPTKDSLYELCKIQLKKGSSRLVDQKGISQLPET